MQNIYFSKWLNYRLPHGYNQYYDRVSEPSSYEFDMVWQLAQMDVSVACSKQRWTSYVEIYEYEYDKYIFTYLSYHCMTIHHVGITSGLSYHRIMVIWIWLPYAVNSNILPLLMITSGNAELLNTELVNTTPEYIS